MPTFEKRRNADGQVTAIRVKLRRVGQPHLSHSVPVDGEGSAALSRALRQAQDWAAGVQGQKPKARTTASKNSRLADVWNAATEPMPTASATSAAPSWLRHAPLNATQLAAASQAATSLHDKALLQLLLHTGMQTDELARLRWQHIHLDGRCVEIRGLTGSVLRTVPLHPMALESLLILPSRKYGLVFRQDTKSIAAFVEELCIAAGVDLPTLHRQAAWNLLQRGADIDTAAAWMGVDSLSLLQQPGVPQLELQR